MAYYTVLASNTQASSPLAHSGWMTKSGVGIYQYTNWSKRWFELHLDGTLTYSKKENSTTGIKIINLRGTSMAVGPQCLWTYDDGLPIYGGIVSGRVYIFTYTFVCVSCYY